MDGSSVTAADERFTLENLAFEDGVVLEAAHIAFTTTGRLNAAKDNLVLLSTGASGSKAWAAPFTRAGGAFDPARWCVVSVDPLGGGGSTKPSDGQPFTCSIADHAEALSRFVRERFGVSRLRAFAGASMASFIGVHWAAARPREIANLALWTPGVFSDAYSKRTLTALAVSLHAGGAGVAADVMLPHITSRAFLSGATQAQADTMRGALANSWSAWDPNDLIGRYNALKTYDPVAYFGGVDNLARKIEARALFLVCDEDQVTPAAQVRTFARRMRDVRVRRSPSPLGHLATVGQPGSAEFTFFDRETARFLRGASK